MIYKAKLKQKVKDEDLVPELWAKIKSARSWKKDNIDCNVARFVSLFKKELYGNEVDGRSKTIDATIQNYCNSVTTSLKEPIMNTSDIVRMTSNVVDDDVITQSKKEELLLNYQFKRLNDKHNKLDETIKLFVRETMVCNKVYWEYKSKDIIVDSIFDEDTYAEYKSLTSEELELALIQHSAEDARPVDIKHSDDGTLTDVTFVKTNIICENPSYDNIPIANMFWNSSASKISYVRHDMDLCGEVKVLTNSEIRYRLKSDKAYRKFTDEELDGLFKVQDLEMLNDGFSETEIAGKTREIYDEIRSEYSIKNDNGKQVVVELHIWYDIDKDGQDELLHVEIMNDKIIRLQLNNNPNNMIPYNVAMFDREPFDTSSAGIPSYLEDTQKLKTAIVRNMQDTLGYGTLQNYIIEEGALDKVNQKRFMNRVPGDMVFAKSGIRNGFSLRDRIMNIPSEPIKREYFEVYNLLDKEAQENSGISTYTNGSTPGADVKSATEVSAYSTMSMKRLMNYFNALIHEQLTPLIEAWRVLNSQYLETKQVGMEDGEPVYISKSDIDLDSDIDINLAIKGFDSEKINQILQLLQLAQPMIESGVADPEMMTVLFSSLVGLWDMPELATKIKPTGRMPMEGNQQNNGPATQQNGINPAQQNMSGYNNSYQQ